MVHDLSGFQRDLLYTVSSLQTPTGVEIKTALENGTQTDFHPQRVYTNLDALVEKGYIKKDNKDGRANKYQLTEQATEELTAHLNWIKSCHTITAPSAQND